MRSRQRRTTHQPIHQPTRPSWPPTQRPCPKRTARRARCWSRHGCTNARRGRARCLTLSTRRRPTRSMPRARCGQRAACASALLHTDGDAVAAAAMWDRTLGLAAQAGDDTFDARALVGQWHTMLTLSDIHESLRYATRFERAAERRGDRSQRLLANAMVATSLHYFGEHAQARAARGGDGRTRRGGRAAVRAGSARRRHDDARAHDAHAARVDAGRPRPCDAHRRASGRARAAARPRSRFAWCWGGRRADRTALRRPRHHVRLSRDAARDRERARLRHLAQSRGMPDWPVRHPGRSSRRGPRAARTRAAACRRADSGGCSPC